MPEKLSKTGIDGDQRRTSGGAGHVHRIRKLAQEAVGPCQLHKRREVQIHKIDIEAKLLMLRCPGETLRDKSLIACDL
jgi:hypothetical protein